MVKMTYVEASREAVREMMHAEFGKDRVADTPISEAAIMGAAFGAAMVGTRPIVEMRFSDFALCATDELVNQIAKARFMFGGQSRAPMVIRKPIGLWRSSAAQHSQSLESWYVHIPGLVVVCPATLQDNYSMMKAAIKCDDPVVYLEHKNIWGMEGEVDKSLEVTLGAAAVLREGADVTLVSWSDTANLCAQAAEVLATQGVDAEVIDLRSLWPWDKKTVIDSVRKTHRLVVAHESVAVGGFGAEVVATVVEAAGDTLRGPVRRLGAPRSLVAYAPNLEDQMRVTETMIIKATQEAMGK